MSSALQQIGIDPGASSTATRSSRRRTSRPAYEAGLWRFAFDSEGELHKLARHAPGSAVYVRVRVDDSTSTFPLSKKFGTETHKARALMVQARAWGHAVRRDVPRRVAVRTARAWRQAIAAVGR